MNRDTAKRFFEEIFEQNPELKPCPQQIKFQPFFFKDVLSKFWHYPYRHRDDFRDNCEGLLS